MRKLLLLLAVAVALSLTGFAQAGGGQTSTESTSTTKTKTKKSGTAASTATKESQLTGCLAKSAEGNGFMLTNGRYKKGVEVKSSEDISAHVGHEVKLMGTWEKPAAGEKGAGAKGETMRTFNATSLKHIADTCPAAGASGEHKGGKKGGSTTPPAK